MDIQFDFESSDPEQLLAALRRAGHPVRNVRFSRWIRLDLQTLTASDNGSRLDVEVGDDYIIPSADGTTATDKSRALARTLADLLLAG